MSTSWFVPTHMTLEEGLDKLKPKVRREFKRKVRRIEKLGKLSFKVFNEFGEIEKHLDIFFDFYEQSWKGKERNADFYYKIASEFSQRKEFILFCLCLNERPIAYTCALKSESRLFCLKTTFNPAYCAFSSGSIMFYKIFENSFNERDIKLFDIGRGDETYKLDFESVPVKQMIFICGHKRSLVSFLFHVRFKMAQNIKSKKFLLTILTYLKNTNILLKKIPVYIKKMRKNFRGNGRVTTYFKPLSFVKSESKYNEWLCRKADMEDMEHLAVAMKAKRFTNLKERLANDICLLIMNTEKIQHYFWFSQNNIESGVPGIADDQLALIEIDPPYLEMNDDYPVKIFNMISNELIEQNYNFLFAFSNSLDSQRVKLFNSLGFQEFKSHKSNNGKVKYK
jgi:hypothetical protein